MRNSFLRLVVTLGAALFLGLGYLVFSDMTPPRVTLTPPSGPVGLGTVFTVKVEDAGAGLASVKVKAAQGNAGVTVLEDKPAGAPRAWTKTFSLPDKAFKEGPVTVSVEARDASFGYIGRGHSVSAALPFTYDAKAPSIAVLTLQTYVNMGGSALVVFTADEELSEAGVLVKDLFFPAYRQPDGRYAGLYAYPYYLDRKDFAPKVVAKDLAGNQSVRGIVVQVRPKAFRHDTINVSESFLNNKIVPEFQRFFPNEKDPLQLFLKVNTELRDQNQKALFAVGRQTSPEPLWKGEFLRMKDAAPMARFADTRSYMNQGRKVDQQTHLGQDLASLQQAPVHAANDGKVVFADYLGIYGNCVILDHGLGLQSLYAHLTTITVKAGDKVSRGQGIATSGATGMAGGDHLHYQVNISGLPVDPIEWWDPHWLKDNITDKLAAK